MTYTLRVGSDSERKQKQVELELIKKDQLLKKQAQEIQALEIKLKKAEQELQQLENELKQKSQQDSLNRVITEREIIIQKLNTLSIPQLIIQYLFENNLNMGNLFPSKSSSLQKTNPDSLQQNKPGSVYFHRLTKEYPRLEDDLALNEKINIVKEPLKDSLIFVTEYLCGFRLDNLESINDIIQSYITKGYNNVGLCMLKSCTNPDKLNGWVPKHEEYKSTKVCGHPFAIALIYLDSVDEKKQKLLPDCYLNKISLQAIQNILN